MKDFIEMFEKDIMKEGFSTFEIVMMGVIAPVVFVLVCIFVNLLP